MRYDSANAPDSSPHHPEDAVTLFYLAFTYLIGIQTGRLLFEAAGLTCALPGWLWLAPVLLLPAARLLRRRQPAAALTWPVEAGFTPPARSFDLALAAAVLLCLAAGALRYAGQPYTRCWTPADLAYYNLPPSAAFDRGAPRLTLRGYISSYPLVQDTDQELIVTATAVEVDGSVRPVQGQARLKTGTRLRYAYGQPVRVAGRLVTPPDLEGFSYREYLARKEIHSLVYSPRLDLIDGPRQGSPLLHWLYAARARGEAFLNRALPEPYAALANGMVLGIEAGIPDELYDQFNATGSSHVIVISGSNVALISGVIMGMAARLLGRRRAVWPTLAGIACYALLVGGDAAVVRAAVMGSLVVVATALNRRSAALVSLTVACMLMTLLNPLALWDVGLQLSSLATAGLILFVPTFTAAFQRGLRRIGIAPARLPGAARAVVEDGLVVTVAATVMTLPLIVYYFGRLSVVSLATNLLIVPVQPLVMLGGSAGVLAGIAGLDLPGQVILWAPWVGLAWTVAIVRATASLPGASWEIASFPLWAMAAAYLSLFGLFWRQRLARLGSLALRWARFDLAARVAGPALLTGLTVAGVLLWSAVASLPDARLHVWFLDIGQGDGVLIQTPGGRRVLIDGGASPQQLFSELGGAMPFWERTLDLAVLTHPDGDHMLAQADAPLRFRIAAAWDTLTSQANPDGELWRARMAANGAVVHLQHTGGWADLGDGVALWVLWPPPGGFQTENADNENSLVLKLVYGDFSVLLTGDAGLPSEAVWLREGAPLAATVLKVGHHGSAHSTGRDLVAAVAPQAAVIQVGADNDYGHPTGEVLENLAGRLVLRNDLDGTVHVVSDGRQMWVMGEHGSR